MRAFRSAVLLGSALLALAASALPGHAYTQDQQQACTPDAFRLCGSEIPDVDRITACMARNRAQLSPACAAYFRSAPAARAIPVTRRVGVHRSQVRKPAAAKTHKAKRTRQHAS